jgi:hypothetical protein
MSTFNGARQCIPIPHCRESRCLVLSEGPICTSMGDPEYV